MDNLNIRKAENDTDLRAIAALAREIWPVTLASTRKRTPFS